MLLLMMMTCGPASSAVSTSKQYLDIRQNA